jgi:hypothetical protein
MSTEVETSLAIPLPKIRDSSTALGMTRRALARDEGVLSWRLRRSSSDAGDFHAAVWHSRYERCFRRTSILSKRVIGIAIEPALARLR